MYKKIGIIGGLSPESTCSYYTYITRTYARSHGDCSYPEIIIYSVSLEKYHVWRNQDRWDLITHDLVEAGSALERAGAEIGLIATNTMHKVFDEVQRGLTLPLVNLLDVVRDRVIEMDLKTVGLLGTRFTMSEPFYREHLESAGIGVIVPDAEDQTAVHDIIEGELVKGVVTAAARSEYLRIIRGLVNAGARGIILGCTEIPLLIRPEDVDVPTIDTAEIHADRILKLSISEK